MIQSLENFVSMAIQGTQVPMYTKHTLFLYFFDFSIFFIKFLYEKQNKPKQKKDNKNMLNNQSIKTRLTQNLKAKYIRNAHTKTRREREKKYPMIFDIPILLCLSTRMSLTSHFCYAEAYKSHTWLAGNSGEMVINAFLSGFFSHSRQKEWYEC